MLDKWSIKGSLRDKALKDVAMEFIQERMITLIKDNKITNKKSNSSDSYFIVNETTNTAPFPAFADTPTPTNPSYVNDTAPVIQSANPHISAKNCSLNWRPWGHDSILAWYYLGVWWSVMIAQSLQNL